jgi:hypothetical protein
VGPRARGAQKLLTDRPERVARHWLVLAVAML